MTIAILDSTFFIHAARRYQPAIDWMKTQKGLFSITPFVWMEIMVGVTNKRAQAESLALLNSFEMLYLTQVDIDWAMRQMLILKFSQGVGVMDCLNAAPSFRLQIPVYTHNVKDYLKLLPASLVVKPYE